MRSAVRGQQAAAGAAGTERRQIAGRECYHVFYLHSTITIQSAELTANVFMYL